MNITQEKLDETIKEAKRAIAYANESLEDARMGGEERAEMANRQYIQGLERMLAIFEKGLGLR